MACQANLRQWGLVLNFYTDDNNGYFMSGSGGSDFDVMAPLPVWPAWMGSLPEPDI